MMRIICIAYIPTNGASLPHVERGGVFDRQTCETWDDSRHLDTITITTPNIELHLAPTGSKLA